MPLTALLRAYRVGHTRFSDWMLTELAQQAGDAEMISAATLGMSRTVAGYIDQTSEEMVAAYTQEREHWLRNRSAARAARIRDLLSGERIDVAAAEVTLGYRLRQYHVGVVRWAGTPRAPATRSPGSSTRSARSPCRRPVPASRVRALDESSAWAWLPLGIRDTFDAATASTADLDGDIHFAFGDAARGTAGFRLTHQQAVAAQAVALAAGLSPGAGGGVQGGRARGDDARAHPNCCGPGCSPRWRAWPTTTSIMPGCARPCWSSCKPGAATR